MPPQNVLWPEALCFLAVRQSVSLSVRPERCYHNILKHIWHIFTNLQALLHFGPRINASTFGIKRSNLKVTVGFNVLENALLALFTRYLELLLEGIPPDLGLFLVYLRPKMNWLDFEGRVFKVKVTARSYVKNLRPHIGLKYHNHIWGQSPGYNQGQGQGQGQGRFKVNYFSELLRRAEAEMELGLRVTGHRVAGSAILAGSGRVTGQCVRPGVRPGFEF